MDLQIGEGRADKDANDETEVPVHRKFFIRSLGELRCQISQRGEDLFSAAPLCVEQARIVVEGCL